MSKAVTVGSFRLADAIHGSLQTFPLWWESCWLSSKTSFGFVVKIHGKAGNAIQSLGLVKIKQHQAGYPVECSVWGAW